MPAGNVTVTATGKLSTITVSLVKSSYGGSVSIQGYGGPGVYSLERGKRYKFFINPGGTSWTHQSCVFKFQYFNSNGDVVQSYETKDTSFTTPTNATYTTIKIYAIAGY